MLKHLIMYFVLALVLVSCNSQITAASTATAYALPPTQVPTSTPSPTPQPTPARTGLLRFDSFRMMSETVGWGTTYETKRILRTTDGGLNWQDVSPSADWPIDFFFLDGDHAWAVTTNANADSTELPTSLVWQTQDGGQTWNKGEPLTLLAYEGWEISFVDPQHGWLLIGRDSASGSVSVTLYKTEDGGIRWQEILTTSFMKEPLPESISLSCYRSFLTFRDDLTGWMTGSCSGYVLFKATSDGGLSWGSQEFPFRHELFHFSCVPYSPTFFSPQEGIFQIICQSYALFIYHTQDGGQTWDLLAERGGEVKSAFPADFVDMNNGWHFAIEDIPTTTEGYALYVTHDGGKTWSQIDPVIDVSDAYFLPLNKLDAIGDFDFLNSEMGWAVLSIEFYEYSLMLKTTDGGSTWTSWVPILHPVRLPGG